MIDFFVRNAVGASIGSFFVVAAFDTAQNFATSVAPELGSISLAVVYGTWVVSTILVASPLTHRFGIKNSMILASVLFTLYIASSIKLNKYVYIVSSVFVGFGAAIFFVSQNLFTHANANLYEEKHKLNKNGKLGMFNAIFNIGLSQSKFIGNLIGLLVFQFQGSSSMFYICMTIMAIIGIAVILMLVTDIEKNCTNKIENRNGLDAQIQTHLEMHKQTHQTNIIDSVSTNTDKLDTSSSLQETCETSETKPVQSNECSQKSISKQWSCELINMKKIIQDPNFKYVCLIAIQWGITVAWIAGDFASFMKSNTFKFSILSIAGFSGMIFSAIAGHLSDKIGSLTVFIGCTMLFLTVAGCLVAWPYASIHQNYDSQYWFIWIFFGIAIGMGDAGYNTIVPQIFPIVLGSKHEVFAIMRAIQGLAISVGFAYFTIVGFAGRIVILAIVSIVGVTAVLVPNRVRKQLLHV